MATGFLNTPTALDGLPSYYDLSFGMDSNGKKVPFIDTLSQQNDILNDFVPVQCNNGNQHVVELALKEPEIYQKRYNKGVPFSTNQNGSMMETCTMYEGRAQCDWDMLERHPNKSQFLSRRDLAFRRKFAKVIPHNFFYGSQANAVDQFNGMQVRYNSLTGANAGQILNAGGTELNGLTSVWLIVFSPETIFTLYPQNSVLGIRYEDLGRQTITGQDKDGRQTAREVQMTKYNWDFGVGVADPRYAVRICNIDLKDLRSCTGTQAENKQTNIVNLMMDAMSIIPDLSVGRAAFYCGRYAYNAIVKTGAHLSSNAVKFTEAATQFTNPGNNGQMQASFFGIPLRRVDALKVDEKAVS